MKQSSHANHLLPIKPMPSGKSLETPGVFKALTEATRSLAELQGTARSLPNQNLLIDTLSIQEALASSEIENIVTTQDEVFHTNLFPDAGSVEAKEVQRYNLALRKGYSDWEKHGFISENMLIGMFQVLKKRSGGYRTTPGTVLRNEQTGETVYTPPQDPQEIITHMRLLEKFINETDNKLDPLIKMALIHHQFESIHPFPDGNGRIGRILNVLYLTHAKLLDMPILYLSRGINSTKSEYYRLLQAVREHDTWEEWVVYMLNAVTGTSRSTLQLVSDIRELMKEVKQKMRDELPKIYSQDLLNHLFRYPYTRIEYIRKELGVHYNTATNHLKKLTRSGFIEEKTIGRNKYYINRRLTDLLASVPQSFATVR